MDILERIYPRVSRLEDFLKNLNGCPPLSRPKDKEGYKAFMQSTLVGIPSCHSNYQGPLDYKQYSDQTEVLSRVLLRLKHQGKGGKNVLLNGFSSWRSEGDYPGIPSSMNVPNNNSTQLRVPYWSKLLSRIGDEVMMHILENLSIFTSAPPSCYIQLTGTPVSMLISSLPPNISSPTKRSTMNGQSNPPRKNFQFRDAYRRRKIGQNKQLPEDRSRTDAEGRGVNRKRKRDAGDDGNDYMYNVTKAQKEEHGKPVKRPPKQKKQHEGQRDSRKGPESSKEKRRDVDNNITGLERSYYILHACYSRTVGRTHLKYDVISKLPVSNSGAQKLTQHIFNSSEKSAVTPGIAERTASPDGKGKREDGAQRDDGGRKKKKPQRTYQRLIKVQALLKAFLTQHRKLKISSILNHQCPLIVPQDSAAQALTPTPTSARLQKSSKMKHGSHTKKTSSASIPSSENGTSTMKSLAELREESKCDGYSPPVFHRKKKHELNVPKRTSLTSLNGKGLGERAEDGGRVGIEENEGGGRKELTKNVVDHQREEIRDRKEHRGVEEGIEDDRGNMVGEAEGKVTSMDIKSGADKQNQDSKRNSGSVGTLSEHNQMETDGTSTSFNTVGDSFKETSVDSLPSQHVGRLRRSAKPGIDLSSNERTRSDDALRDLVMDSFFSQPEGNIKQKTSSKTRKGMRLPSDAAPATDETLRDEFTDDVRSRTNRKIRRKDNSKTETGIRLLSDAAPAVDDAVIPHHLQSKTIGKIRKKIISKSKAGMRLPNDAATLIKMKTDPWQVCLFLRQVLLKVVPDKLWGSVHNRNVFFKGVKKFVQLGRFERLSLRELTDEIRVEDCEWSELEKFKGREPPFTSLVKQRQLVVDFFHWLMVGYTIPLIKMCFYVTETSSSRNQLVFYRKPVWLLLEKLGIQYYVDNGIMKPIKESDARKLVSSGLTLGFSRLHFVPKTKSLRPITRMGKSVIDDKKGLSVKLLLQDLFDVFTYHKMKQHSIMGSSLLGIDGIYQKVLSFIQDRKARQESRPLYFVKIDIEKCYDSIKHSKLYHIISMLLQGHDKPTEYQIHRYVTVTKAANTSAGLQKTSHRHVTTELNLGGSFHRQLIQMAHHEEMKNAIIINQVNSVKVTPVALLQRLKQHVMADIVKSGRRYYWRHDGISQGSILSSLLCSFFYAHLERCYLSDIDQEGLMMRLIDDFILITPHLDKAQRFLQLLLSGVKQYGCSANPSKTLANFDFMFDDQLVPRSTETFPWCGIVFNTQTLNISNDYTKYNNVSIRYTLTISTDKDTSLHHMRTKLTWSLRAKNVSIFMDPQINSFRTIVINVHHLLLLLAYRFHSYYHCLASSVRQNTPPLQFYNIWASCVRTFHSSTVSKLPKDDGGLETTFPLTVNTVNWIGLKAFETKLSKHKGLYHPLIKQVKKHRRKAATKMGKAMLGVLDEMTNPALPEDFIKMKK